MGIIGFPCKDFRLSVRGRSARRSGCGERSSIRIRGDRRDIFNAVNRQSTIRNSNTHIVGVDVGGTFTDFVALVDGELRVHKRATTPDDRSRAIMAGLDVVGVAAGFRMAHGTTVATNALLERGGARTALLTTAGFADVIEIGRQNRPELYSLSQRRPPALIPRSLRFEIRERIDAEGRVVVPLDDDEVRRIARRVAEAGVESLAIVLLFSFLNPDHERRVGDLLCESLPDLPISLSHEILPEYREYERTSTVVVNAYVRPLAERYLGRLVAALGVGGSERVRIMGSNGGGIGPREAAVQAARLVLSGPAGGVVGAFHVARRALNDPAPHIITFDMGGTSTDVSLCPGRIGQTAESIVAGLPLRFPTVDIHTVGAGGGSIAWADSVGVLHVGPQSAGADPGPACYGRGGTEPTVSDANLVLGRLDPGYFLGGNGEIVLDTEKAWEALERLGGQVGMTAEAAALGLVQVVNATMERALRRVSVERGYDPREFVLVPFGGAGPLHACALASALGIRRILVPLHPGALSALGMLVADSIHDESCSVLSTLDGLVADPLPLVAAVGEMAGRGRAIVESEANSDEADVVIEVALDLRYRGQSYELTVPLALPIDGESLRRAGTDFRELHASRYGYALRERGIEAVTVRVRALLPGPGARFFGGAAEKSSEERHSVYRSSNISKLVTFDSGGPLPTPCYLREELRGGDYFDGPAIVVQLDTTTLVPDGWRVHVDSAGDMWITR